MPALLIRISNGTEILHACVDDALGVLPLGHVALDRNGLSAHAFDQFYDFFSRLFATGVVHDNVCAFAARARQIALPTPLPPPVTTAFLPSSFMGDLSFNCENCYTDT